MMKPEQLYELLLEVEQQDPLNFAGLPFDADDLRKLACLNVVEMMEGWRQLPEQDKEMIMGAAVVRLVLENLVLNARLCLLAKEDE
jgi:hypothetical protein